MICDTHNDDADREIDGQRNLVALIVAAVLGLLAGLILLACLGGCGK